MQPVLIFQLQEPIVTDNLRMMQDALSRRLPEFNVVVLNHKVDIKIIAEEATDLRLIGIEKEDFKSFVSSLKEKITDR